MLTVKQVAERLQVHAGTVRRWLESRELRGVNLRGKAGWRIPESALREFLKERGS